MLLNAVNELCSQYGYERIYYIAYSGGLDSHVLLYLCQQLRSHVPIKLRAIYVNHGLSTDADAWAEHCQKICNHYGIELINEKIQLKKNKGKSLEELARVQRYAVFEKHLKPNDVLLTAHHQDDQAETFLLQLLRGAGVKGLAAMPLQKRFGCGFHGRPLLYFSKTHLQKYAEENNLQWITDQSNFNKEIARNFIRHNVLSLLETHYPAAKAAIARSAMHCADAENLLAQFGLDLVEQVHGTKLHTLSVKKLSLLNSQQQKLALRVWIKKYGYSLPSSVKLDTIQQDVLLAANDRKPCVKWGNTELRRFRDDLYLLEKSAHDPKQTYEWDLAEPLHIPHVGSLHAREKNGTGLNKSIKQVRVGFRHGGEIVNLHARGKHTLKNLLQEWNIPTWERSRIPLIFFNNKLISAVGYFIDPDFAVSDSEVGYELELGTSFGSYKD